MQGIDINWPQVQRGLAGLAVPLVVLAAAAALEARVDGLTPALAQLVGIAPYVIALVGMAAAWRFNASGTVFTFAHWLVDGPLSEGLGAGGLGRIAYPALALLLPVNVAVLAGLRERGVLTAPGLTRIAVMLGQVVMVAAIVAAAPGGVDPGTIQALQGWIAGWLDWRPLPGTWDGFTPLPQPALIVGTLCCLFLLGRGLWTARPRDVGLAAALLAAAAGLHSAGNGMAPSVFLGAACLVLAIAVVQESYRMAFLDELTGLPGRRALNADLAKLGSRYAIAMLDVDRFKKFNDTHGHEVGDQVLRMVAARMMRVRGGGRPFRYGGEEFTVLFPGKDVEQALPYLEALRRDVEASGFFLRGAGRPDDKPGRGTRPAKASAKPKRISVTISIGVADAGAAGEPEAVIVAADAALYRAKEDGRNRVRV